MLALQQGWFEMVLNLGDTSLLQTPWEKEKLLLTSNYTFPTVFPTLLENFLLILSNLRLSSAISFCPDESKICCLGRG